MPSVEVIYFVDTILQHIYFKLAQIEWNLAKGYPSHLQPNMPFKKKQHRGTRKLNIILHHHYLAKHKHPNRKRLLSHQKRSYFHTIGIPPYITRLVLGLACLPNQTETCGWTLLKYKITEPCLKTFFQVPPFYRSGCKCPALARATLVFTRQL